MTEIDAAQISLARRPIPSMLPVPLDDWLRVTPDYAVQMREKARLLATRYDTVVARSMGSEAAEAEFAEVLIGWLAGRPDYTVTQDAVIRPDGAVVARANLRGLDLAARLIQEDVCLLDRIGEEHVLKSAVLAFPASWSLAEKLGRPLGAIHGPVAAYDAGIAARVQRMFDGLAPGRVLSRANLLGYADPALHQPRSEADSRPRPPGHPPYLRSERQTLRKLPASGAVVFTILTTISPNPPPVRDG